MSPARQPAPSEWKRQAGRVSQDVSGRPPLPPAPRPPASAPYITPQACTLPHCRGLLCSHAHASPPQAEAQLTPRAPTAADREGLKAPSPLPPALGNPCPCGDMNSKLVQVPGAGSWGGRWTGRERGGRDRRWKGGEQTERRRSARQRWGGGDAARRTFGAGRGPRQGTGSGRGARPGQRRGDPDGAAPGAETEMGGPRTDRQTPGAEPEGPGTPGESGGPRQPGTPTDRLQERY